MLVSVARAFLFLGRVWLVYGVCFFNPGRPWLFIPWSRLLSMYGSGSYYEVSLDGAVVVTGGEFGTEETRSFP